MNAPRMIRCINGHVFNANADSACPVCGWTKTPSSASVSDGKSVDQTDPRPNRRMIVIAASAAMIAGAGAGIYAVLNRGGDNNEDPNKKTENKISEKKSDSVQRQQSSDTKASDAKPGIAPEFAELQALQPTAQIAAANSLKLSPFTTEIALVTRATLLSGRQPTQLDYKRLLVNFVKAGQPLALSEAGAACYFGYAVRNNDQAAFDYLTRAANQGAVRARAVLAQAYVAGRGTARNRDVAGDLLSLAARADSGGSAQALVMLKLQNRTLDGVGPTSADLGRAVSESNWPSAVKSARILAALQIASGYNVLGERHWQGIGLDKNPTAAIDWWKKAAAIGYPNASYNLSLAANDPPSGSANIIEAMVWLQIAFLQSEDKPRSLYFTDKISAQAGLLDGSQWGAIKTLFADLPIPGPK